MLKEFAYHKPSQQGQEKMNKFREAYSNLLEDIRKEVAGCPELALVQQYLEISNMFLNKAINLTDTKAEIQI